MSEKRLKLPAEEVLKQPVEIDLKSEYGDKCNITTEGARVKKLQIGEVNVIREDDGTNSKRSGIPILGLNPGAVEGVWEGMNAETPDDMNSHGSDRRVIWNIVTQEESSVELRREYDGKDHPLIGRSTIKIDIKEKGKFTLTRATTNTGNVSVKVGTGLHSYFNKDAKFIPLSGTDSEKQAFKDAFPLENNKDFVAAGAVSQKMIMETGGEYYLVEATPEPETTHCWAENKEDHQCIEPWWAEDGNASELKAGETRTEIYTIKQISQEEAQKLQS